MARHVAIPRIVFVLFVGGFIFAKQLFFAGLILHYLIASVDPHSEPAVFFSFLIAQLLLVLSSLIASTEFVRIGFLPGMNVVDHSLASVSCWAFPSVLCMAGIVLGDPLIALLAQLGGIFIATIGAEALNLSSDRMLVPSPGRTVARVLHVVAWRG